MKNHTTIAFALFTFALLAPACDEPEMPAEASSRDVYFDGAEIKAMVAEDPSATFFVDARDGIINHFDQSEETIDFSNFMFQCPSMLTPVPMETILEYFDESTYSSESWTIHSMQSPSESELEFRRAPICTDPDPCMCECPNGLDCLAICPPGAPLGG